jgi:hypothetical protein
MTAVFREREMIRTYADAATGTSSHRLRPSGCLRPLRPLRPLRRPLRRAGVLTGAVLLLLGLLLGPWLPAPAAQSAPVGQAGTAVPATPTPAPPPNNPAGPQSQYAWVRSDQLFVSKVWAGDCCPDETIYTYDATYQLESDLSGIETAGNYVVNNAGAVNDGIYLLPTASGRFTDALHDQVLYLNQFIAAADNLLTYTLGPPNYQDGSPTAIPNWQPTVPLGVPSAPAAIAAGDLDGRLDASGYAHDEAVMAYVNADNTLNVTVVDYNVTANEAVATGPSQALPVVGFTGPGGGTSSAPSPAPRATPTPAAR